MKYTKLGKTGLEVSSISFGGIPIQRGKQEDTDKVVDELVKAGVNFIDTARLYTVSEGFLGNALKGRRDKFFIATKTMARDYETMKKDIDTSLKELQTNYIDLYQMHNVPVKDIEKIFGEDGAYKALVEAKQEGKIGHIGITAHSLDSLKIFVEEYDDKIETVMFPFNIVENQGEEILKLAKDKQIGTIAMKPFAGGNILNYQLALRYIYHSGLIDVAIPGMGSDEEVKKNTSVDLEKEFSEEEKQECEKIRKELGQTFCRRCGYCGPCTVGIDIPGNFLYANYLRHYEGLVDWAIKRYQGLEVKADACVECGLCESKCPYNLPIRDMLKEVAKDFDAATK